MAGQEHPLTIQIDISKTWTHILPAIMLLTWVVMKVFFPESYIAFIQEDGILENLQALFYGSSSILCFYIGARFLGKRPYRLLGWLYFILALGLLFVALEEISWGQRIFDIETPEKLLEANTQQEISLHNLEPIQSKLHLAYILVGLCCFFGWHLLKFQRITSFSMAEFIIPDKLVRFYFLPVVVVYVYFDYLTRRLWNLTHNVLFRVQSEDSFLLWRDQEPAELFLAMGFFMFAVVNIMRQRARLGY